MPTFKVVSLEEAIEATRVDRWLEEQFGEEYEYSLDEYLDYEHTSKESN
jgi:hypothetical protein|tara:strand:+ start:670 stop:816 length:147 start_codon:yes stop_codon:yes gene_type:complete